MLKRLDNLPVNMKGVIVTAVPAIVSTIYLLLIGFSWYESQEAAKSESEAKEILFTVQKLGPLGSEALNDYTAFVLQRNDSYFDKYKAIVKKKDKLLNKLDKQLKSNPNVEKLGRRWLNVVSREFKYVEALNESVADSGNNLGVLEFHGFKRQMQVLYPYELDSRREFISHLSRLQRESEINVSSWNGFVFKLIPVALGINIVLALLLATYYSRNINRRLNTMIDNTSRLAAGKELNAPLAERDEIGKLDRAFHTMAIQLEEATLHEAAIVNNAVDVICSISETGDFDSVNSAATKTWGYKEEELIGKSLFSIMHSDDVAAAEAEFGSIAAGREDNSFESRLNKNDGTVINVSWSVNWLEDDRKFYMVAHDITQRKLEEALLKESEQMIRLVLESMPVGLLIANETEAIEITNLSTKQMFGYRESEIRAQPLEMLLANSRGTHEREFLNSLHLSATGGNVELLVKRKDGETFPAELNTSAFQLDGQTKTLVVIQDITLRHEVERLKKDFIAMVSHDLRTPLTTMLGTMQLLQAGPLGPLNEQGKNKVSAAESETERLITLVNTLLDIEKFEAGQMELHRERTSIAEVVSQSIKALTPLAEKVQIKLKSSVARDLNANVDRATLVQVIINLLSNAIKFSPQDSEILVSSVVWKDDFEIRIKDQGRGIPEALRQTIFERFKQVDVTDRTEKKGSGLGLSICKLIVESHGGSIGVESAESSGSTFYFRIPYGFDSGSPAGAAEA